MRRADKEISDRSEIDEIIRGSQICHMAFAVEGAPYVLPLSFGYDGVAVYFHSARSGKKIEYLHSNPRVCFEFTRNANLLENDTDACGWSFSFESAIGYGVATELLDPEERERGLNEIMRQYSGREWRFHGAVLANTSVWRVRVDSVTGKRSEPKPD